jgi:hypothetical protein
LSVDAWEYTQTHTDTHRHTEAHTDTHFHRVNRASGCVARAHAWVRHSTRAFCARDVRLGVRACVRACGRAVDDGSEACPARLHGTGMPVTIRHGLAYRSHPHHRPCPIMTGPNRRMMGVEGAPHPLPRHLPHRPRRPLQSTLLDASKAPPPTRQAHPRGVGRDRPGSWSRTLPATHLTHPPCSSR